MIFSTASMVVAAAVLLPMAAAADEWDYVIAGAGTSGCALAAQLAKAGQRVLLLERGPDNDWAGVNRATGAVVDLYDSADSGLSQHHSEVGEGFFHKALPFQKPRPVNTMEFGPQGQYYTIYQIDAMYSNMVDELPADWRWMDYEPVSKIVGGCSMHNYQVYIRPGNHSIRKMGWDPEVILPKFEKMEAESLPITPQAVGANSMAFGKAFDNHGCEKFARGRDVAQSRAKCAYGTRDASWHPDMKRIGSGDAFLTKDVRALKNFKLVTHANIQRVIFGDDGVTATGVEYKDANGTAHSVYGKETVLSAGVLNTPKILMHSGIGPAEELNKFDIPVRVDLPVGKEMHNHLFSNPCFLLDNTAPDAEGILSLYMQYRSSFAEQSGSDGDIWVAPSLSIQRPDNTTEFCVTAAIYDNIKSKGQLHLVSADPDAQLQIDHPYWKESQDLMLMQEGWNFIRQIMEESDLDVIEEITHSPTSRDKDANGETIAAPDDMDQIIRYSQTVYHNVGTAAIGRVVDDKLRVMGVNNLRVVDNSISPEVPNSNTQALAYIIGYHGADILLGSENYKYSRTEAVPGGSPDDVFAYYDGGWTVPDINDGRPSIWAELLSANDTGADTQATAVMTDWAMAAIPNVQGSKAGRTRQPTHSNGLTLVEVLYYSDAATRTMNYELLGPMGLGNSNDFILNALGCNYDGLNVVFTAVAAGTGTEVNWSVTADHVQSKACADAALNVFYDIFTVAFNEKFPYTAPTVTDTTVAPPTPAAPPFSDPSDQCAIFGGFEQSEDVSVWKENLLFVTTGMFVAEKKQGGGVLAVDLAANDGKMPAVVEMVITGVPADYKFGAHGMFIDNATQRVYLVSHDESSEEESIGVFQIVPPTAGRIPSLAFMYALTSPKWPYYTHANYWFLNDVVTATGDDGTQDLYASQFGPFGVDGVDKFYIFHCTWNTMDVKPNGRLEADCNAAPATESPVGLNGMTISTDGTTLWANQLFNSKIIEIKRNAATGALTRVEENDITLTNLADNIEYDYASGDIMIGDLGGVNMADFVRDNDAAVLTAVGAPGTKREIVRGLSIKASRTMLDTTTRGGAPPQPSGYTVSATVSHGGYIVFGSPYHIGLAICKAHSDKIHIDKSYPLPAGTDPTAVATVINDWQNSVKYLAPGTDAMFSSTGADVGAFRSFLHVLPGIVIVEELVAKTETSHTYTMVEGTSFDGMDLASYTATHSVEDGNYRVVADMVYDNSGPVDSALYGDAGAAAAFYTGAFYDTWLPNIMGIVDAAPKVCGDFSGKGKWSACKAQGCSFDLKTRVCTNDCARFSGKGKYKKCKAQAGCKFDGNTKVCSVV